MVLDKLDTSGMMKSHKKSLLEVLKYPQSSQLLAHIPSKALFDAQLIHAKSHWSAIPLGYVILQQ
jgi:hypothetical protein